MAPIRVFGDHEIFQKKFIKKHFQILQFEVELPAGADLDSLQFEAQPGPCGRLGSSPMTSVAPSLRPKGRGRGVVRSLAASEAETRPGGLMRNPPGLSLADVIEAKREEEKDEGLAKPVALTTEEPKSELVSRKKKRRDPFMVEEDSFSSESQETSTGEPASTRQTDRWLTIVIDHDS